MKSPTVLCLTHSADYFTIDSVMQALRSLGYQAIRVNGDHFPMHWQATFSVGEHPANIEWTIDNQHFTQESIVGVWLRKDARPHIVLPETATDESTWEQQCSREATAAKSVFYSQLRHVPWIDKLSSIRNAENKGLQLDEAQRSGLMIPDTIITNSPEQAKGFYHKHTGNIVTKMLTPLLHSMGRPDQFVYTSKVEKEHLDSLDGLRFSPMVFQEHIEKAYELRIAYVGGRCFTGKIDATKDATAHVDWRKATGSTVQWEPYELPAAVTLTLCQLMQRLNLLFGAIDMIVTPKGEYVFLEVNPCGEWGMLESALELPISNAIAECLHQQIQLNQ